MLDVCVVLLDGGYASTALMPIEVFHSAGALWRELKGETPEPRFRVVTASVDGKPVSGPERLRWVASLAGVGSVVTVRVARGARQFEMKVTLEELRTSPPPVEGIPFP